MGDAIEVECLRSKLPSVTGVRGLVFRGWRHKQRILRRFTVSAVPSRYPTIVYTFGVAPTTRTQVSRSYQ